MSIQPARFISAIALTSMLGASGLAGLAGAHGQQSVLSGTVLIDGTNEPAADATVTLIDPTGRKFLRTSHADVAGLFHFPGVEPARYVLSASKASFMTTEYGANKPERIGTPIVVGGGLPVENLRLMLFRAAVLAGTVWGPDGQLVARVTVTAYRQRHQPGGQTIVAAQGSSTTDDRGRYRIFGLPPGEYLVAAVATGRGSGSAPEPAVLVSTYFPAAVQLANAAPIALGSGEEKADIDIRTSSAATATLKVTLRGVPKRTDGTPLSVRVSLVSRDDAAAGASPRTGTAVDEAYLFQRLPLGRYRLSAITLSPEFTLGPGVASVAESNVDVLSAESTSIEIALRPGCNLIGSVELAPMQGQPDVTRASLRAQLRSTEPGAAATLQAQSPVANDGTFSFFRLLPGRYRLEVRPVLGTRSMQAWRTASIQMDGRALESAIVEIASGQTSRVRVTLRDDTATLSGSLAGVGQRGAAPFVVLMPLTSGPFETDAILVTRPASDGSFELTGIRSGTYAVAVLEDFDPDEANNPDVLAALKASAKVNLSFAAGERKRVDLR